MYSPPAFREDRPEVLRDAIRRHPLATLVTYGSDGLQASLLPFILTADEHGRDILWAHLAKANGQVSDLRNGADALVIFQGPQAYITPSWYPTKQKHGKVVPTWNYVVVQAWGRAKVIDDADWLSAQVKELTTQQEKLRETPWAVTDAPAAFVAGQLKGIIGIEIPVDRIEGKWKASQNQPAVNRKGVVEGLRESDPDSLMAALVSSSD
jgi:transcriptional regulator